MATPADARHFTIQVRHGDEPVAIVKVPAEDGQLDAAAALERAFRLTNNVASSWVEDAIERPELEVTIYAGVLARKPRGCRSTSVGDQMRLTYPDGRHGLFQVVGVGFAHVEGSA